MDPSTKDCWVGFDLGGTKMLAQVYDPDFNLLGRDRRKTKGWSGQNDGLARIVETIDAALGDAGLDRERVAGIGIGCPGPVDMDGGILLQPPNLGWNHVPVGKHLSDEFGCEVSVLNDVDAGVYGEYRFGAAKDARCVVGIFPGTGIGGGCVYRGEILHGAGATCMEVGHIQVVSDGPLCGCGQRGCLEAVASRLAIAANSAKAAYRGEAPGLMDAAGTDLGNIRSGALAAAVKAGDESVRLIIREAARTIGIALAGIIHVLGPDLVLLGGGLVEAMPDLFIQHVGKAAQKRVMPALQETFQIGVSELGDDASVQGAAAWAEHQSQLTRPANSD